jgi:hypothetical protein
VVRPDEDRLRPHVSIRDQRGDRRPLCQRPVRRYRPGL